LTSSPHSGYEPGNKRYRCPIGFWECDDLQKRDETIKRNMRSILQLFDIKVLVYLERVEIKGAVPTQILDKSTEDEPEGYTLWKIRKDVYMFVQMLSFSVPLFSQLG
jgi:hypothetical protein